MSSVRYNNNGEKQRQERDLQRHDQEQDQDQGQGHEHDLDLDQESDPSIDFCNINPAKSLSRPSDHFQRNPYLPPPRKGHMFAPHQLAARFIRDPVNTTLSGFSKVANYVLSPHEEYENVLDLIHPRVERQRESREEEEDDEMQRHRMPRLPPPALPQIPCSCPQMRFAPLTDEEFVEKFSSDKASDELLFERILRGGIGSHDLRKKLWPLILGLTDSREEFDWEPAEQLFDQYCNQWLAILPDQENRFTAFRERKSIVERDVVRCDRSHPFFQDSTGNVEILRNLLMTYIMYDFDTGYVQGMSDLASPLLYVWGDVKKAFWCFVNIMNLFKRNFEMSQNTISFQLQMLWKLIKTTDPCFAQYLGSNESDNCYFAFRWIICQFKREFMKAKTDEYDDCLTVWETIWSAHALSTLQSTNRAKVALSKSQPESEENESLSCQSIVNEKPEFATKHRESTSRAPPSCPVLSEQGSPKSSNGAPERLRDVELFTLCICLSIIRRERDLIMANGFDACEILKHFNTLELNEDLNSILLHASTIWYWIKHDGGEEQLYAEGKREDEADGDKLATDCPEEDFDLLNDEYLLLNSLNV